MSYLRFENLLTKYIAGEIDLAQYRRERTQLVKLIEAELEDDDDTQRRPGPATNQFIEEEEPTVVKNVENTPFTIPTIEKEVESSGGTYIQYIALVILVTVASLTWYFSADQKSSTPTESIVNRTSNNELPISTTKIRPQPDKSDPFIIQFIGKDEWNSESLSDFLVKWQTLTRKQQATVRQSPSFNKLTEILRSRIMEQRALKEQEGKIAERQENLLLWFAAQLSIGIT